MSRAVYNSQTGSREEADRRVAAIRAEGRWASEPAQVYAPNGKVVWGYSAGFDVEEKKADEQGASKN